MKITLIGKTILIVDDEVELANSLKFNLELEDATVFIAHSGSEALNICMSHRVDFVVSDIRMPKGDGIFLTKELRARDKAIPPILLSSGYTDYSDSELKAMGAIGLLPKPLDIDKLCDLISNHIS